MWVDSAEFFYIGYHSFDCIFQMVYLVIEYPLLNCCCPVERLHSGVLPAR